MTDDDWFCAYFRYAYTVKGVLFREGYAMSARRLNSQTYEVRFTDEWSARVTAQWLATHCYRKNGDIQNEYDIEDYATTLQAIREERDGVDDLDWAAKAEERAAEQRALEDAFNRSEQARKKAEAEREDMRREMDSLREEKEGLRKQRVAEEYGVVTERHLWEAVIIVPAGGFLSTMRGGIRNTEVITENKSMAEAAIAAEAIAKGIHKDAFVGRIEYDRKVSAVN